VLKIKLKKKTLELLGMPRRTLGTIITGMSFGATPGLFEMLELESH